MKAIIVLVSLILLFSFVSADSSGGVLIGKQNECVTLPQSCSGCTFVELSHVVYPNLTQEVVDGIMTKVGTNYNHSFCSTSNTGNYHYCTNGDVDGTNTTSCKDFIITTNGNDKPQEFVVVFFAIAFLTLVCGLLGLLIYNIAHMVQWDFDLRDLIFNFSAYFALFIVYILGEEYLGNLFIGDFLLWMIGVTAVTNMILPVIAFVLTYVRGGLDGNQEAY